MRSRAFTIPLSPISCNSTTGFTTVQLQNRGLARALEKRILVTNCPKLIKCCLSKEMGSGAHLVLGQLLALHQLFHPTVQLLHRTPFLRTHLGLSTSKPPQQPSFLKDSQFEGEEAAPHNLSDPDFSLGGRSDRGGVAAGGRAGGEVVCCSCHQPAPAASLPLLMRASRSKNVQPAHVHTRWLLSPYCACSQTPGRQLWRLIQFLLPTKSVHNKSESKTINFES